MTENEMTVRAALPGSHLDITDRTGINERTVRGMRPARAKAKSVAPQKATWITPLLASAKKASTFTYLP